MNNLFVCMCVYVCIWQKSQGEKNYAITYFAKTFGDLVCNNSLTSANVMKKRIFGSGILPSDTMRFASSQVALRQKLKVLTTKD